MIGASSALVPLLVPLHGIGGRQDLPIPFGYLLAGSAIAVAASFAVLGLAWRTPRYRGVSAGVPLSPSWTRLVDSAGLRWTVRGFGLAVFAFMGAALLFGRDLLINPIFGFVYVWVWVGLVPVSLLLGPVWRTLNPLRTLHLLGARMGGGDPDRRLLNLPPGVGVWPATLGLIAFVWLELVAPDRVTIPVVLMWASLYVVAGLAGAVVFGQRWFSAADPFEVYALLVAKLSPWGRRDGELVLRRPLENLDSTAPRPGLVLFVAILLGSTAYDGFSNSTAWVGWVQNQTLSTVAVSTVTLFAFILVVLISYTAATAVAGTLGSVPSRPLPALFVHTLVPIVLGYVTAHYLTLFVIEGQRTLLLVSDPLSRGWNLFGTARLGPNFALLNYPTLVAVAQAGAVVLGHILGVVSAHDRALAIFPRRAALAGQLPLLIVMIGYTVTGLWLLFSI